MTVSTPPPSVEELRAQEDQHAAHMCCENALRNIDPDEAENIDFDAMVRHFREYRLASTAKAEERIVELEQILGELLPNRLCGESRNPPLPDDERIAIYSWTWGLIRRARALLSPISQGEGK